MNGGAGRGVGNPPAAPTISTAAAQNGAVIASIASTTPGAIIFYTVDGSTPTPSSQQYQAPFLVASSLTVNAIAIAGNSSALTVSAVTSQAFTPNIPSGTLAWSDEFTNSGGAAAQPNPAFWTYDTGNSGFGNNELENYCPWGLFRESLQHDEPQRVCGNRRLSAYRGAAAVSRGLHLGTVENSRLVQLSVRPA